MLLLANTRASYSQDAPTPTQMKTLLLKPATLGYADEEEVTPGCVGALELTFTFSFKDPDDCWAAVDIDAPLRDIEWIKYEVWDAGTSLTFRIKARKRPFLLGLTTIQALKVYRHVRKYSPVTTQRCATGSLNDRFEKSVVTVSCDSWAGD
jgi:hypothetical protein